MTINSQFTFDDLDEQLRTQGLGIWNNIHGARIGDYVELSCGTLHRISLLTADHFQLAEPRFGASYYWAWWYCSFSGGHKPVLYDRSALESTGTVRDGDAWMFHHDQPGAHRGVSCTIPCRVYRLTTNS